MRQGLFLSAALGVDLGDLAVQGPEIVQHTNQEQAPGEQIDQRADPLAQVQPVHAEDPEERQEDPGQVVVHATGLKAHVRLTVHRRNQEQVDQPADTE